MAFQIHNPYFCLFTFSSGLSLRSPAEGGRSFWCLILGPLIVARPLARLPRSVAPPARARPLPTSASQAGSVPGMGVLWLGPLWLGLQKPVVLPSAWEVVALHLQKPNSYSPGMTPNGGSKNSRFSSGNGGPIAPARHMLRILMFQPSSRSDVFS